MDRPVDPTAEPVEPAVDDGERTASAIYDADRPPFEDRPEQPKRPLAPAAGPPGPVPLGAGPPTSRGTQLRLAAAVLTALFALLLLRRRCRHGLVRGRARRS